MRILSSLYMSCAPALTVAVMVLLSAPAMAGDAAQFASVIDDLPLMAEIVEVGEGVEFSTSDGRIAEVTAQVVDQGRVTRADVLAFYAATLPQLGWMRTGETTFVREGEMLSLMFETDTPNLRVRFALAPNKP